MGNFPKRLRTIRKKRKLTQRKLAELSGISDVQISKYENGDAAPTITFLEWLCTALEVSSKDLLGF